MLYLKEFKKHSDYEEYISGTSAVLPNVSICDDDGQTHYKPFEPEPTPEPTPEPEPEPTPEPTPEPEPEPTPEPTPEPAPEN